EDAADNALKQNIKIDMFAISNSGIENKVSYGSQITQGELYVVDSGQTIEEAAEKYLFQTSGIGKIELGESVSSGGSLRVDLQDIYMQNAKIFLVSDEKLKEFHVTGQCGLLNMIQGSRFAVAKLENPLEEQITVDYSMENKGNVRIYLMKEYFMEVNMEKTYTSEEGSFALRVDALNHQDKSVFDADHLRKGISISIDGKNVPYDIVDGTAVVPYQAAETHNVIVAVDMDFAGSILHYEGETETVELIVPVIEEKPDYRILYIVLGALFLAVIILFSVYYRGKQKKNVGETVDEARRKDKVKYDFSGKLTVYLMTGEREEDIPPCSIKLFGRPLEGITFNWIKNRCGIGYALADADKVRFMGGRDHSLCFINDGCATVVKESQILQRGQRYSLYYGEKILLIFNNGATEIELHYQNIKPSER
ncbi:MAG: VWA domain-containing protein, partial [Lachnospiraceae bacterium]|nr:VWA domain-containing protein [Lachnospiraceae bacterium]